MFYNSIRSSIKRALFFTLCTISFASAAEYCISTSPTFVVYAEEVSEEQTENPVEVTPTPVPETIKFEILATSDLHGQVVSFNYENLTEAPKAGLSKIATLITAERNKYGKSNTLLVDAGDCLYDYTSNFFYDNLNNEIQPIFQAMAKLGYDALTVGNHDFDYPWNYLQTQLTESGLMDKTIVCNAVDTVSGEYPFRTSMTFIKKMKTSEGRSVRVKVSVVGATYSKFSARRYRYSGVLDGLDIYSAVKAQAKELKNTGSDIVVVVIHGGVGVLSGANTAVQAGSRLASLSYVDAVVCGHSHETFPNSSSEYQNLSNVDTSKGTMYGTPVVQTGSHAENLGTIQLTLRVDESGKISIQKGSSAIKPVKASTAQSEIITSVMAPYEDALRAAVDTTEYPILAGLTYTNADCVVKDSALFQLMNNAKIHYASSYIARYAPEYQGYPLIAASINSMDCGKAALAFSDKLTESDIYSVLTESSSKRSSGYIHIYKITGQNLTEWLEFNASIYATVGAELPELVAPLSDKYPNASSLIRPENVKDVSTFFAFDGISYDIDLTVEPRYNSAGKVINYGAHRIKNLTYNGQAITSASELIITMDSVDKRYIFMPTDEDTIFTKWLYITSHEVMMDYIRELSQFGVLNIKADNNWHFLVPEDYQFVVAIPKEMHQYVIEQDWFNKKLKNGSVFYYYLGTPQNNVQTINAVASPDITLDTARNIPIQIYTQTAPGAYITEILAYGSNIRNIKNTKWLKAKKIKNNTFIANHNGKYSFRITDSLGNQVITHIIIDNIKDGTLEPPILSTPTNRISAVKGTAIPNSTVNAVMADGSLFTAKTDATGSFAIDTTLSRAGDIIYVWIEKNGNISPIVETTVLRTGANRPSANPVSAGDTIVIGNADPYTTISIRTGKNVYVALNETAAYKASSVYNKSHKIQEVEIVRDQNGNFSIPLPSPAESGQTYYLYVTDRNGNASRAETIIIP